MAFMWSSVLPVCLCISVVLAGWKDYQKELDHLRFQNSQDFQKHIEGQLLAEQIEADIKTPFPCKIYKSDTAATSVHNLRPCDIKVMGALGDSITAGNGIRATNVAGSLVQFRGFSWDVGGETAYEDNVKILPNILKLYNPDLTGYSLGIGAQQSKNARCNVAAPGSKARDMPGQARLLVERLQTLDGSSFHDDWKLITIFVGGNDLCDHCLDPLSYSAENYTRHIEEALDILADNVPKAFVNVVSVFDVSVVAGLSGGGVICDILQWALCKCAIDPATKPAVQQAAREYARHLEQLIHSGKYDKSDGFTVVSQPFLRDTDAPKLASGQVDLAYFAHDCFHFSQKGHNSVATLLWNSMEETFATAKNSHGIIHGMTAKSHDQQDGSLNHGQKIVILTIGCVAAISTLSLLIIYLKKKTNRTIDVNINLTKMFQPASSYQAI